MLCWHCRTPIPESYADNPPRSLSGEPIHRERDCVGLPGDGAQDATGSAGPEERTHSAATSSVETQKNSVSN